MINYIPSSAKDREDDLLRNPLYTEIYIRRADVGCSECDNAVNGHAGDYTECKTCFNNSETMVYHPDMSTLPISKLKNPNYKRIRINKLAKIILNREKCPLCTKVEWTSKLLAAYLTNDIGELSIGELQALYCPICGRDLTE